MPQRQITCPFCTGSVLTKEAGKATSTQPLMKARFSMKIPLMSVASKIFEDPEKSKKSLETSPCKACGGKGTIPDPHDDTSKYEQAAQKAQQNASKILKEENKLGQPGGSRYTIIRGSDLLEVGLGFNDKPSYRVDKGTSVANDGIGNHKVPSMPAGAKRNTVVGIQSPWPEDSGNYMIKCANNFQVLVGAGGIKMTTGGPVIISGGITQIVGPEVTIGSSTGGVTVEGETVMLRGKSIEAAPSEGHFFVKGSMSNTGNVSVGGHMHAESTSFVNAICAGRNDSTVCKPAAPSDSHTGPAVWGGIAVKGLTAALKDLVAFTTTPFSEPDGKGNLLTSPRGQAGFKDKMKAIAYQARPWEQKETGYILPGTQLKFVGTCPCNYGGTAAGSFNVIATNFIKLNNFPHNHGMFDGVHSHDIRVPDMDFSSDNAEELRGKVLPGLDQNSPKHIDGAAKTKQDLTTVVSAKASGFIVSKIIGKAIA
jgi:hypothetical protein